MAKTDSLLMMDYKANSIVKGVSSFSGTSSATIDTSPFLLRDGTRTMLDNLDIGGFSIVNVNLLDGVDLPTFFSSYNAHIINANAHHNQAHGLISSDHTVSGLTVGNYLRANSGTSFGFAQVQHDELGGVNANQHHNQIHAIVGSDHTVVGSAFDLIGLSATNTLSVLTPSADVSTGIERILKSSSSGNLNLASLTTILINSASELTLNPVGNIILDSQAGATIPGGTIQDDLGAYNRKWRTLFAAELYVETLVAQDVISTIGGRIMVAPTTTLIADVSNVATTIDVKHNNLQSGDFVVLQAAPAGIAQVEAMRIVSSATTIAGGYRYSVTRNLDGSGANNWLAGDAVVDITDGYIDLTSTSTMLNHFGPVVAIYDRTSVGSWNGLTATVAMGNIRNFVDFSSDTFGIAIGNNLTLTPSTGFIGLSADNVNGIRLFNTPLRMFNGAIETIRIGAWNDVWIGVNSSDKRLEWNGNTLTVRGAITIQAGSTGFTNITDRPTSLSAINSTEANKLSGIAEGATRNTIYRQSATPTGQLGDIWYNTNTFILYRHNGSSWEVVGNNYTNTNQLIDGANLGSTANWNSISSRPARFKFETTPSGQPAGLYLTSTYTGYWNGSTFTTYMDNTGRFIFTGSSGAYVAWDRTRLFGGTSSTFSTSTSNWYIDSTNGSIIAGMGTASINRFGFNISPVNSDDLNSLPDGQSGLHAFSNNTFSTRYSSLIFGTPMGVYGGYVPAGWVFSYNGILPQFSSLGNERSWLYALTISDDAQSAFVWHSLNDGSGSGLDADLLDGLQTASSGIRWNVIPTIASNGVMEVGRYIDFHETSNDTSDYSYRLTSTSNVLYTSGSLILGGNAGESWSNVTPLSGWQNFGSGNAVFGIKRFGDLISVKGIVTPTTNQAANSSIYQLPSGYRPSTNRAMNCRAYIGGAMTTVQVNINTDGNIRPQVAISTGQWVSLEMVFFIGG